MFHIIHDSNGFESRFSASLKNIDDVCKCLERFLQRCELENLTFDMILGAREILNNAVIHGCAVDESLNVRFSIAVRGRSIVMQAADEGPGFDYDTLTEESECDATSGRGMGILAGYFDTVLFRPPGNRVELQKTIDRFRTIGDINMTEIYKDGDHARVKLECDIVSSTVEDLRSEFKQILKDGISQMNLDLEEVNYVDSMGIGLLVATHNSLQRNGKSLQLSHASENITRLLKQMRLDMHFELV